MKRAELFVLVGMALMVQGVLSSPIVHQRIETTTNASRVASSVRDEGENNTTTLPTRDLSRWNQDYVASDADYQRALEESASQIANSIKENPSNYVRGEAELDEILRLIEERERLEQETSNSDSTTSTTTTTASPAQQLEEQERRIQELQDWALGVTSSTPTVSPSTPTGSPSQHGHRHEHERAGCSICLEQIRRQLLNFAHVASPRSSSTTPTPPSTTPSPRPLHECSICLEELRNDEQPLELECHHRFHFNCIKSWFDNHSLFGRTCPNCRRRSSRDTIQRHSWRMDRDRNHN